ncbi:hypothetical protein RvY_18626 [Ramazzottius varieornatus]|uniref:MARVEL domain-containing protein n=1 Tax=Ramazzottius varieornatus TaxID=947166 RepID=A0A1D1W6H2_RAMVA|nr:hypothetical protein RvY_18626 [Ramazzottius varieornatus]
MMAEMPPTTANQPRAGAQSTTVTTTVTNQYSTPRGIGLNKAFLTSIPGILLMVAVVLAFVAMVCVTASLPTGFRTDAAFEFHEAITIISFISLLVFTLLALLQFHTLLHIRAILMKFIMLGLSSVLALMTLISSAVLLDFVSKHQTVVAWHPLFDLHGLRASGAFGLLESFTLFGVTVVLALDILGIRREGDIFQ